MRNNLLLLLLAPMMLIACNTAHEETENILQGNTLAQQMAGEWRTTSLYVEADNWMDTDLDTSFTINQNEFEINFGFAKNQGHYKLDGTFEEFFISSVDTVLSKVSGNWDAKDDTIYVQQMYPNVSENHYHFELKGDTGYFKGYLDWDRDGKRDDYFVSKAVKVQQ